jgi:hypothetical protein
MGSVGPAGGAYSAGPVSLKIAPGNFQEATSLSILPELFALPIDSSLADTCNYVIMGSIYCCGPLGQPLPQGGTLRLYYDPALIPPGFTENELVLLLWDDADSTLRPNLSPDVVLNVDGNYLEDPSYTELGHMAVGVRDCPILALEEAAPQEELSGGASTHAAAPPILQRRWIAGTVAPTLVPTTGLVDAFVPSRTGERVLFRTSDGGILRDLWSSAVDGSAAPVGVGGLTDRLDPVESLFGWVDDATAGDAFFAPFFSNYFAGLGGPDVSFLARRSGDATTPREDLTSLARCIYFDDLRQSANGSLLLVRSYDYSNPGSPWRLDVVDSNAGAPHVLDGLPELARPAPHLGTHRRDNLRPAKAELYPWQGGAPAVPLQNLFDEISTSAGGVLSAIDAEPHQSQHSQFRPLGDVVTLALALEVDPISSANAMGIYDVWDPSHRIVVFDATHVPGDLAVLTWLPNGSLDVTVGATTTNYASFGREFGFYLENPARTVHTEDMLNDECSPQVLVYQGRGQPMSLDHGATSEAFVPSSWLLAFEDMRRRNSDQDHNDMLVLVRGLEPVEQPALAPPAPAHLMPRWLTHLDRVYGIEVDGHTVASFAPDGTDRQVLISLGAPNEQVLDVCLDTDDATFAAILRRSLPPPAGEKPLDDASASGTPVLVGDVLVMGTLAQGILGSIELGEQVTVRDLLFLAAPGHVVAGLTGHAGGRVVHARLSATPPLVALGPDLGIQSLDDLDVSREDGRLLLRRRAPDGLFVAQPDASLQHAAVLDDPAAIRFARWVASTRTTCGMSGLGAHR